MGRSTVITNGKAYHSIPKPKFRVPIAANPISMAKIKAIADYKLNKIRKNNNISEEEPIKVESKASDAPMSTEGISSSSKASPSSPAPSQVKETKTLAQKHNISNDNIKKELDNLNKSSIAIRKEMLALATIRNGLLWLLRKTTLNENTRNHLHS